MNKKIVQIKNFTNINIGQLFLNNFRFSFNYIFFHDKFPMYLKNISEKKIK